MDVVAVVSAAAEAVARAAPARVRRCSSTRPIAIPAIRAAIRAIIAGKTRWRTGGRAIRSSAAGPRLIAEFGSSAEAIDEIDANARKRLRPPSSSP